MQNVCKLELEMDWSLLEKQDASNLNEIKSFYRKASHLPYLKLKNQNLWIGETETITALISVLEKKSWFRQYAKKCIFYDVDGSADDVLKNYGQ